MIQIANVLCPVDFSEFSRHALDHAAAIARWYEARLTVLHVFQNRPAMELPPMVLEDRERECLVGRLHELVAPLPRNLPVELSVREGSDIHREILAQAESVRADLLVIGSHGRSGVDRLLLGSVAEKTIRRTRRPVMVVPARAPDVRRTRRCGLKGSCVPWTSPTARSAPWSTPSIWPRWPKPPA